MNKIPVVSSVRPGALYVIRPKTICLLVWAEIKIKSSLKMNIAMKSFCKSNVAQHIHARKNVLICLHVFDIDMKSGSMVMKV